MESILKAIGEGILWLMGRLRLRRLWRLRRAGRCTRCGYDVRGTSGACPECGRRRDWPVH